MPTFDPDQEKTRTEQDLRVHRQIAFASGLFQGDVTIRTLLESIAEGVVIIDDSGTILLANARAENMFGYLQKELTGKSHDVLVPERFRKVHQEHMAHFFAEPRIRPMDQRPDLPLQLIGLRLDGTEFHLEISLSFLETLNGVFGLAFVSDITLRRDYETRLKESDELFHLSVTGVKEYAIFTLDPKGYVLHWNAGAECLNGYRAEEIIGKHFSCFYPEEDRSAGKPEEELKKAADEGQGLKEGFRVRKDGSRFWADVLTTALHDERGNLRGFSKVIHDITGRKKTEDALRFSEERYRALFRDNPTMIVTLDDGWRILSANPSVASQLGYTIDELEGESMLKLIHADDRAAVIEQFQSCLKNPNQVHHWQFQKVRKDGGFLWVEETAQAVYDLNGALSLLMVCQDVTERKQMEDALRESEERFRLMADTAPVLIWMAGTDSLCTFFSRPWLEFTGRSLEQEQGNGWAEGMHPDDRERCLESYLSAFRARRDFQLEYRLRRADGVYRWIADAGVPRYLPNGDFAGYIGSCFDITERKLAEEEVKRLNQSLAERAAELEAANVELEAFNYTVAHDLRQPLNMVNNYCQVITKMFGDQLPEECLGYIEEAYNKTLQMNRLIEALLNFSRMGQVEPHREMVDLSLLARESAKARKMTEPERQVDFRIADGIAANGEANLLRVVFDNLFGNAWKFTGMREQAIIEFGVKESNGVPTYYVRDNGAGFDVADADKLFTPFRRLPGAENQRGFGIGLATVERIIRRHGGKIWAEGEPDQGACFYFTISAG